MARGRVFARYRIVLVPVPVLMLPAAAGVVELGGRLRKRSFGAPVVAVVVGLLVAIVANWPAYHPRRSSRVRTRTEMAR